MVFFTLLRTIFWFLFFLKGLFINDISKLIHTGNDFISFLINFLFLNVFFLLSPYLFSNFFLISGIIASSQENVNAKKYDSQCNVPKETIVKFWTDFLFWYIFLLFLSNNLRVFCIFYVNISTNEKERNKK